MKNLLSEKEFLIFYLIFMSRKWELFKINLNSNQKDEFINNYKIYYNLYITEKQLLPPIDWWKNMHSDCKYFIFDYIKQFSDYFDLELNI